MLLGLNKTRLQRHKILLSWSYSQVALYLKSYSSVCKSEQDKMTLNLGAIYGWGGCNIFSFFGSAPGTLQKFIVFYKAFSLLQDLVTFFRPIKTANITDYGRSHTAEISGCVRTVNIWGQCKLVLKPCTLFAITNTNRCHYTIHIQPPVRTKTRSFHFLYK